MLRAQLPKATRVAVQNELLLAETAHVVAERSGGELIPIDDDLLRMQAIKDRDEIALLRRTNELNDIGYTAVREAIYPALLFIANVFTIIILFTGALWHVVETKSALKGASIPGFSIVDCHEVFGDMVDRAVTWKTGSDVGRLAGKPVRLHFQLKDADLYAFWFDE